MGHGHVCFVGVGPGDPALRTERAARRIAEADVVVGAGGDERASEAVPVERLIALAREGKRVARVVAGDPLESAWVVEQARALVAAGVAIEVVPGIGARGAASSFAGVLGPAMFARGDDVDRVLAGAAPGTLVTLVTGVASPGQRVRTVSLEEVLEEAGARARESASGGDLLVAVGVPDEALRWAERRPLFGKRILITRALEQAGSTAALLREAGAEPVVVPTIEIRPPTNPAPLAAALAALRAGAYPWVAFTSPNGVDRTWEALAALGADTRAFGAARVAAIGPATARAVEEHGLRPDVVAREFRGERLAEAMLSAIGPGAGAGRVRVLLPRAAVARDILPEILRQGGCTVDVVPAYETHPPPAGPVERLVDDLTGGRLDAVTFTSSSTVDNFCDLLGPRAAQLLGRTRVASIGPITTASAERRGLHVDVTAREYTVAGLIAALTESYG